MSKEIIQGNKLIAEFMGAKWSETNQGWLYWFDNPPTTHATHQWNDFALQYHSSWDWLMPVVEKIQAMKFKFIIGDSNRVTVYNRDYDWRNGYTYDPLIECVWHGVTQFIIWYNTKSKNNSGGEKVK